MKTIILSAVCLLFIVAEPVHSKTMYVYDQAKLWSRTGPSNEYKVYIRLSPGTKLEVIGEDANTGYTQVKDEQGREYWISSKYLTEQPTANILLKKALNNIEANNLAHKNKVQELQQRIKSMLPLEEINQKLQSEVAGMNIELEQLRQSNSAISSRFNREVFFAGGLTIIVGILFGWIFGVRGRKRNSAWN